MSFPTRRAFFRWESDGSADFLQLINFQGSVLGGIDALGNPQGNLIPIFPPTTISFPGVPTGSCTSTQTAVNTGTGDFYSCSGGSWVKIGPTAGSLVSPISSPNPLAFDVNLAFKGPNPYVDVTRYGVRSTTPNVAPSAPGITATINSGSNSAAISSASTFQNGDGILIFGAGAAHSMSTPAISSVTPSVANNLPGLGWSLGNPATTVGPAGSTTYNYKVVARDLNGGFTAASAAGTTATGQTLGYQTVNISSMTRSGNTISVVTSTAHGLAVGALVQIGGTITPVDFTGWFIVATVVDNTHFTFISGMDTAAGAAASATVTSGTVSWWNCNHIVWPAITGAYIYYIYSDRQNPGTFSLIGVSYPNQAFTGISISNGATNPFWDDFGHTMNDGQLFPYYIPTTAPVSPQNDNLSTTISGGAGTTTLTLVASAGTSVSGATILFDNVPGILAAQTAAVSNGGMIYYPSGGNYVVNSSFTFNGSTALNGTLTLNDTAAIASSAQIDSHILRHTGGGGGSFQWEPGASVLVDRANPGFAMASGGGNYVRGLNFSYGGTNQRGFVWIAGVQCQFEYVQFQRNNNDYLGIDLDIIQGQIVNGTFFNTFNYLSFVSEQGLTGAATPGLAAHGWPFGVGNTELYNVSLSARGIYFEGPELFLRGGRCQAGTMPVATVNGTYLRAENFDQDTMTNPFVVNLGGSSAELYHCGPTAGGQPIVSGKPFTNLAATGFGTYGQNFNTGSFPFTSSWSNIKITNGTAASNSGQGTSASMGYLMQPPVAPTVSIGVGSFAAGTYFIGLMAVDALGNATDVGTMSSSITVNGSQGITVTYPAAQLGQVAWNVCIGTSAVSGNATCALGGSQSQGFNIPVSTASSTFSSITQNSPLHKNFAANAGVGNASLFAPTLILTSTTFANLGTPADGTFHFCPDCTIANPCASGGSGAFAKRLNSIWVCN